MIDMNIDDSTFIFFKNEIINNSAGQLGVDVNKIVEIPNFISADTASNIIRYLNDETRWGRTAFEKSHGAPTYVGDIKPSLFDLSDSIFEDINLKLELAMQKVFNKKLVSSAIHIQKWETGASASPHSDNSDLDGNPIEEFKNLKYVGILYLNDNFEGGNLYFPEHAITIHPNACSMYIFSGGVENIHGVSEVISGTRYSIISFWDLYGGKQ